MDNTEQIRGKIDIVSYINEFVTLKRAGKNFSANCPFHSEKTPSFSVSPERQRWHCFGCQKGGDIFSFLMEYEHIEFPEALRILAKRAGVTLTGRGFDSEVSAKKDAIYTLNKLAAEYYHYVLTKHAVGKQALMYLTERGVSEKVIESFLLGFAPNNRFGLKDYLIKKKGHTVQELEEAGLVSTIGRDTIDFFRGRIIFPLIDQRDNIVGFSGRTTDTTGAIKAKYINTRETLVYHKGEMFFGLNMTKDAIRKENQAILVEGEFDLISCFQNGVGNVVGVKGTALTEKQVQLLSRYASKVSVCFDGDKAGQAAIKRSLPILEKYNLQTTIIVIPEGKDPDESIKTNLVGFLKAVKQDVGVYDYLFTTTLAAYDRDTAVGKGKIAQELLPMIGEITNEIIKEHYLKKLSNELNTSYESLQKELNRVEKKVTEAAVPEVPRPKISRDEMREEYLLSLLFQSHAIPQAFEPVWRLLSEALLAERSQAKILLSLATYLREHPDFSLQAFLGSLPDELIPTVDRALLQPHPAITSEEMRRSEIEKTALLLRDMYLKKKITLLSKQIQDGGADQEVLQEQLTSLVTLLKK